TNTETKTSMFLAAYTLINSLITLINAQKELNKFYANNTKTKNTIDAILEKPHLPAITTGITTFAYFAQKFDYGYEHYPVPTFVLNTLLATTTTTTTLFAALLTAALAHSSSKQYCKLTLKAALQKFAGNYGDAFTTITELEKTASPNTQASIEIEKAELTILKGSYGKGILMLRDALTTKSTPTRNPFEIMLSLSGITTINELCKTVAGIFQHPRKLIEQGLTSYKHNKTALASTLAEMGVSTDKENIDNKLLSIYFHATTGDNYEANRELKNIIQQSKQQDFKTIAFSSDEFCTHTVSELTRTIGLKCSKNNLAYENDMTYISYQSAHNKKQRAQPLAHAQKIQHQRHNGDARDYFCIAYITGVPLSSTGDRKTRLLDALQLVLEADQHAQEYCTKNKIKTIKTTDYFAAFKKFVKRITVDEEKQQELYSAGAFIPAFLSKTEQQLIHGNAHAGNIILQPDKTLCIIDFGDACKGAVGQDVEDIASSLTPEISRQFVYEQSLRILNKQATKKHLQEMCYATAFRAPYLLGRSIAYKEGNPSEAYQTTINTIQEIKQITPEKTLFQRFLDTLMPLCEHLQKEQHAHSI
ncbi:phosphotransferase, partial [Candidatus Woesearchaeota archaeon]|nr:phosphotransferase [Candidatus Woesearchaeota archaeon]